LLSYQNKSKGLEILAEPFGLAFQRSTHSPGVVAPLTPVTRQTCGDFAAELPGVEVVPVDLLSVVIGLGSPPHRGYLLCCPDLLGILNPQINLPLCMPKDALSHMLTEAKPHYLSKQHSR